MADTKICDVPGCNETKGVTRFTAYHDRAWMPSGSTENAYVTRDLCQNHQTALLNRMAADVHHIIERGFAAELVAKHMEEITKGKV